MTTIGMIGAGHIGSQIARLAIENDYNVVISNSRGPETLSALIAELGPKARAATAVEAAKAGDIVVVTVPLKNYRSFRSSPWRAKSSSTPTITTLNVTATLPSSTTSRPLRQNFCRPICRSRRSSRPSTIFMPLTLLLTDNQLVRRIAARWSSLVTIKMPKPE